MCVTADCDRRHFGRVSQGNTRRRLPGEFERERKGWFRSLATERCQIGDSEVAEQNGYDRPHMPSHVDLLLTGRMGGNSPTDGRGRTSGVELHRHCINANPTYVALSLDELLRHDTRISL